MSSIMLPVILDKEMLAALQDTQNAALPPNVKDRALRALRIAAQGLQYKASAEIPKKRSNSPHSEDCKPAKSR